MEQHRNNLYITIILANKENNTGRRACSKSSTDPHTILPAETKVGKPHTVTKKNWIDDELETIYRLNLEAFLAKNTWVQKTSCHYFYMVKLKYSSLNYPAQKRFQFNCWNILILKRSQVAGIEPETCCILEKHFAPALLDDIRSDDFLLVIVSLARNVSI